MITPTDIANLAISRLDLEPITSMDEDTAMAKRVRPVWAVTLSTFLVAHDWSFAKREGVVPARLAPVAGESNQFKHAYAIPDDLLRLRRVTGRERVVQFGRRRADAPEVVYEVYRFGDGNRRAIMTDAEGIAIDYTTKAVILDELSPDAVDALAMKLAVELALNKMGSAKLAGELIQRYQVAFEYAKRNDAGSRDRMRLEGHHYTDARF